MAKDIKGAAEFEAEVLKASEPILVDFWAAWCGPCKALSPVLDELDKEGKIKVVKVNVDENQELAGTYQIMSIPTVMIFIGGKPADSTVGAQPKAALEAWIGKVTGKE